MNYTTYELNTQNNLGNSVRNGGFIIGSFSESTGLSFSSNPTVHVDAASANREVDRLAKLNPNKFFVSVQLKAAKCVFNQPTVISY